MAFAQIIDGQPVECINPIRLEDDNLVSPDSVALWSDEEREAVGILTIEEPITDPDHPPLGFELQVIDGAVKRVITTVGRREIPKSTVQSRVDAIGKFDAVFAVINSQPIYFARWFAPDWPNVFFDDGDMLLMLGAAGCTEDEIAVITA